jgi:hypothetical protein
MKKLRPRLTFANVTSCLALFVALGGFAVAAGLPKNSVGPKQLKKNSVTTAKIKDGAVIGAKIKASTIATVPSAAQATNATHADTATVANSTAPSEAPRLVGTAGQPSFVSPWENRGEGFTPISFYKDHDGVVHLEGLAESPGGKDLVFTLPSGYRPREFHLFTNFGYSGAATDVRVDPNGDIHAGNEFEVSLSGLSFRVE